MIHGNPDRHGGRVLGQPWHVEDRLVSGLGRLGRSHRGAENDYRDPTQPDAHDATAAHEVHGLVLRATSHAAIPSLRARRAARAGWVEDARANPRPLPGDTP